MMKYYVGKDFDGIYYFTSDGRNIYAIDKTSKNVREARFTPSSFNRKISSGDLKEVSKNELIQCLQQQ